jgi:hypothetical protein
MMLKETGWEVVKWINVAQDCDQWVFVNMGLKLQVPYRA